MKILKGTIACKGIAQGQVRIVKDEADFTKFKSGEILVAEMTRPGFISVMKIAGAIVTEMGGITSHPAIVARELGKTCLVGVIGILRNVKNGSKVEVNAEEGWVKILN